MWEQWLKGRGMGSTGRGGNVRRSRRGGALEVEVRRGRGGDGSERKGKGKGSRLDGVVGVEGVEDREGREWKWVDKEGESGRKGEGRGSDGKGK